MAVLTLFTVQDVGERSYSRSDYSFYSTVHTQIMMLVLFGGACRMSLGVIVVWKRLKTLFEKVDKWFWKTRINKCVNLNYD